MDSGLTLAVETGVARLRFIRPESRNSLTRSVCRELHAALTTVAGDARCRFLVLEGSGGAFANPAENRAATESCNEMPKRSFGLWAVCIV